MSRAWYQELSRRARCPDPGRPAVWSITSGSGGGGTQGSKSACTHLRSGYSLITARVRPLSIDWARSGGRFWAGRLTAPVVQISRPAALPPYRCRKCLSSAKLLFSELVGAAGQAIRIRAAGVEGGVNNQPGDGPPLPLKVAEQALRVGIVSEHRQAGRLAPAAVCQRHRDRRDRLSESCACHSRATSASVLATTHVAEPGATRAPGPVIGTHRTS